MKRLALLFAVCLLVTACFKSERLLLDLGASAHPVPEGDWVTGDGEGSDSFSLTVKGDHYLRVEGDTRKDVVLVPIPGRENTYAAAESSENCTGDDSTPECNWEYAIIVVEGETWRQFAPNCKIPWEGMEKDVAKRADDGETCWFDEPAGLQHALRLAAERGPGDSGQQVFRRKGAPDPNASPEPSAEPVDEKPAE